MPCAFDLFAEKSGRSVGKRGAVIEGERDRPGGQVFREFDSRDADGVELLPAPGNRPALCPRHDARHVKPAPVQHDGRGRRGEHDVDLGMPGKARTGRIDGEVQPVGRRFGGVVEPPERDRLRLRGYGHAAEQKGKQHHDTSSRT